MDDEDEKIVADLMRDYKMTREQAEEVLALRENPDGDVEEIPPE